MNEAAERLSVALTIYMEQAGLESNQTFQELSAQLKRLVSDPHPHPKAFAEICLQLFDESKKQLDAAKDKDPHEKFVTARRVILSGYVPDEYFRMRMVNIFRNREKKTVKPDAKLFFKGLEDLLWTEASVEKEYQDIKAILAKAGVKKLIESLEKKFEEYKKTVNEDLGAVKSSKEPKAAVESGAVRTGTKSRPSRIIELGSTGVEAALEKAVVPKNPKTKKQPVVNSAPTAERAKRPPPPSQPPNVVLSQPVVSKEIESTETYKISKETEETKKTIQKAIMSRESETREITENPNKEKFRLAILTACNKFMRETSNKSYKELFTKIAERVTTSPISESARKLYEDIKQDAGEITYFVEMLERHYEEFRQAPGEMYREKAQKEDELKAQQDAKWAELQARIEAKGKKYEAKEQGNKREPTVEEIKISKEVQEPRADLASSLALLKEAIEQERKNPEGDRNAEALQGLEARYDEANQKLIQLEKQLLVASGVLEGAAPKTRKILEQREAAAALDATLKGSLEKLKSGLEQLQADRARQKASVPQDAEEVEKALSEMRRNLEHPAVVQKEKDEASPEDLLKKSQESYAEFEKVTARANQPLMREKEKLLKLVADELRQKREALSQHTGLSEEDIETKVEAVANRGGHETLAQSLAKRGWDVLPAVISDFISVRIYGLLPYDERVAEIKQHCISTERKAALEKVTTQREKYDKEYGDEYVTRNLLEGKFDDTIKSGVPEKFVGLLQVHLKREEGAEKIRESLQQRGAELARVEQPQLPEKQERKRPFGALSFKVNLPTKRVKKEESPVDLDDIDRRMDSMAAKEEKDHQIEMQTVPVKKPSVAYSQALKNELSGDAAEKFIEQVKEGLDYKLMTALGTGSQKVIDAYDKYRVAKTGEEKDKVIKEAMGNKVIGRGEAKTAIAQYFEKRQQLSVLYHDFKLGNVGPAQRASLEGLRGYLKGVDNLDKMHSFVKLMDADAAKNAEKAPSAFPPPGHH